MYLARHKRHCSMSEMWSFWLLSEPSKQAQTVQLPTSIQLPYIRASLPTCSTRISSNRLWRHFGTASHLTSPYQPPPHPQPLLYLPEPWNHTEFEKNRNCPCSHLDIKNLETLVINVSPAPYFVVHTHTLTHRQTDRQTDRQADTWASWLNVWNWSLRLWGIVTDVNLIANSLRSFTADYGYFSKLLFNSFFSKFLNFYFSILFQILCENVTIWVQYILIINN